MAPNVSGAKKKNRETFPTNAAKETKEAAEMRKALLEMRRKIEAEQRALELQPSK